jgi:ABC-type multidrug transport system fused ATPase/permease subunit
VTYLWKLRGYLRQVAGELVLGSLAGIVMNTAVILPAILLGNVIDKALALERGEAIRGDVTLGALLLVGGTLLTEGPRVLKRLWLITANARMRANLRADALRAHRVLGMDRGRIVEDGARAELVVRGGRFAALLELEAAGWDWQAPS